MEKFSVFAGLDMFYQACHTGYVRLPFVLDNIDNFKNFLENQNWDTSIPLFEETANRKNIMDRLTEQISNCPNDSWVVFYFTGHGARYRFADPQIPLQFYCVTYTTNLSAGRVPPLDNFLSTSDYRKFVNEFGKAVPHGHLITVLDCCFANGVIKGFDEGREFHTLIAASTDNTSAFFTTNSLFYQSFIQCWTLPFNRMQNEINEHLAELQSPSQCVVTPATKFADKTFNSQ